MIKTNNALVEYVEKAYNENYGYVLGTYGQILTPSQLKQKQTQGYGVGTYNKRHEKYQRQFLNKRVSDCYGLIKGCLWERENGLIVYNQKQDMNQESAYRTSHEKGSISTMPEIKGLILWVKGHCGVYVGNGMLIECVGSPVGMRKTKVKGSIFTHWFKDNNISYTGVKNMIWYAIDKPNNRKQGVQKLQKDLERLNYSVGSYGTNGIFGPDTKRAVIKFQSNNGLVKDGSAGPQTLATIEKILKGETSKLSIDGYFGSNTISELQIALGQQIVDGKISQPSNVIKELQRRLNNNEI